jgi:hypothetical protein
MRKRFKGRRSYGRKKGGYRKVSRTYYVSRGGIRL